MYALVSCMNAGTSQCARREGEVRHSLRYKLLIVTGEGGK